MIMILMSEYRIPDTLHDTSNKVHVQYLSSDYDNIISIVDCCRAAPL